MANDLVTLFRTIAKLKTTRRQGWIDRGLPVETVESVADHTFMTAIIAWVLALDEPDLDADRVLQLAMVHDLAEAITGDPPPYTPDELSAAIDAEGLTSFFSRRHRRTAEEKERKRQSEAEAMTTLTALIPQVAGSAISTLWQEYEAGQTPEARFVKEADTYEAFHQARIYHQQFADAPLSGFFQMAEQELTEPALTHLRDEEFATDQGNP